MNFKNEILLDDHKLFFTMFKLNAVKFPNKTALIFKDEKLTYSQLDKKSDCLARSLVKEKIGRNDVVAVICDRSIEMVIGIIGTLKIGATFLPISLEYPDERIRYMLEDSNTSIIISNNIKSNNFKKKILMLDSIDKTNEIDYIYSDINVHDLAYIMYTSGTTGSPKGVLIEHGSISNLFKGLSERIEFNHDNCILNLSDITFDMFIVEVLFSLTIGMTIIIATKFEQKNPKSIINLIIKNKIDTLQITPSRLRLILNYSKKECFNTIKKFLIGGETFPKKLFEDLKKECAVDAKIYNMYGPTETTVWTSIKEITNNQDFNSIGRPILNTQFYILDNNEIGNDTVKEGELCIAGKNLARGYLNNDELTKSKFIRNSLNLKERLYKTGDKARILENGEFEILGRIDDQIKLRGHRIELKEIENNIFELDDIKNVAVCLNGKEDNQYLCAYISANKKISEDSIRNQLLKKLPKYMIPLKFIQINDIALTNNGKKDYMSITQKNNENISNNKNEEILLEILRDNVEKSITLDIHKDIELDKCGIDSLAYINLIVEIEDKFGIEFEDNYLNIDNISKYSELISYVIGKI